MKKIQFNVARAKDVELVQQGSTTLERLRNNPYFPDPTPSLPDFEAALTELKLKYNQSLDRGKTAMVAYKVEREYFSNTMRQMINYINNVALQYDHLNSALVIASAGFAYNRDAKNVPLPEPIYSIKLAMGAYSGEILVKAGSSKHARFYEFFMCDTADGEFEYIRSQQERYALITGLVPGKRYYFKVRGVNRTGVSVPSNVEWMYAH